MLKWVGWLALLPVALGIFDAFEDSGMGIFLILVGIPLLLSLLIVCMLVLMRGGWEFLRSDADAREKAVRLVSPPLAMFCLLLSSWQLLEGGRNLGSLARLAINHGAYRAIIEDHESRPRHAWSERSDGIVYSVDVGPPVRVAFNPSGFLSNWSRIVYDPSRQSGRVDATGVPAIREVFGGDLVFCRHLWRDYYRCAFT